MFRYATTFLLGIIFIAYTQAHAQTAYELNHGWKMKKNVVGKDRGEQVSLSSYKLNTWTPAVVPGTVLTSLLANKEVPDPFWGMNNKQIPDIYETGLGTYTYWFVNDFDEKKPTGDHQVWLNFRGINYKADFFLNGKKINAQTVEGMFLRHRYNVTSLLSASGKNRLAVIVYPSSVPGNPNGGQGGDGLIAKNVASQYTAGWDWIKPIADRNTGIWDKVCIEKTGPVSVVDPHFVTLVPGKRLPNGKQEPAFIKAETTLENSSDRSISGLVKYSIDGKQIEKKLVLSPKSTTQISFDDYKLLNPKLWWPANYGPQNLYEIKVNFVEDDQTVSDEKNLQLGVREIQTYWNDHTKSREIAVNGQKIFIKGGNWILSDAMLRFSKERYDAEIRFHRDMNLNLIRIWGGGITERPEFYEACDKYGLLVIQDFWLSGDGNGRWLDPLKKENQWTRRKYPDDHALFLSSAKDMIKMIRNYASLAIWCGGNEITPPADILVPLRDTILPALDGTRWFIEYSNSNEMSHNHIGGNGDGPYTIQKQSVFWDHQTFPFNSEIGSVGVGDLTSLRRFIPEENLQIPTYQPDDKGDLVEKVDSIWNYHTYIGYKDHILPYGKATSIEDWTKKAQLVNYDQYRALMEGFSVHMWDWYTGTIIWKTQNPWTAMRGQMYDYYLDPNASLYGLRNGSAPFHAMYNPSEGMIYAVNNLFERAYDIMLIATVHFMDGSKKVLSHDLIYLEPTTLKPIISIKQLIEPLAAREGVFLELQLLNQDKKVLNDNIYWLPDSKGDYSGLQKLAKTEVSAKAITEKAGTIKLEISASEKGTMAFFNRVSLVDKKTGQRILPTFYDDNYISVPAGTKKVVTLSYNATTIKQPLQVEIEGWNVDKKIITIN